jgi:hypothetical protein
MMLKISGIYSAGLLHFGKHFLETSILLFIFGQDKARERSKAFYILIIMLIILIPDLAMGANIGYSIYNSLYADITLGVMFALTLEGYRQKNIWIMLVGTIFMIITKRIGLFVWMAMWVGIICVGIVEKIIYKNHKTIPWKTLIITSVGCMVTYKGWRMYMAKCLAAKSVVTTANATALSVATTATDITSSVSNNPIIEYLTGNAASYKYELIEQHIMSLWYDLTYYRAYGVGFSFLAVILCCILVLWLEKYIFGVDTVACRRNITFLVGSTVGIVGAYHYLYTFQFSQEVALRLGSENRYLGTFLIGIIMWIMCTILYDVRCTKRAQKKISIIACTALLFMTVGGKNFRDGALGKCCSIYSEAEIGSAVRECVVENATVLYYSSDTNGTDYVLQMYYMTPLQVYKLSEDKLSNIEDNETYLYIYNVDEQFIEEYGEMFDESEKPKEGYLYKITNTDGNICFEEYRQIM